MSKEKIDCSINTHWYRWASYFKEYSSIVSRFYFVRDYAWWEGLETSDFCTEREWGNAKWSYPYDVKLSNCQKNVEYQSGFDSLVKKFQSPDSPQLLMILQIHNPNLYGDANEITYEQYYDFVYHVVERYDGDGYKDMPGLERPVRHFEIGNEIDSSNKNHSHNFKLSNYIKKRLIPAYHAAKKASKKAIVLNAGLALEGSYVKSIEYLERFFSLIKRNKGNKYNYYFDIFAFHEYTDLENPEYSYEKINKIKKVLKSENIHNKPIWITEFGVATKKDSGGEIREKDQASILLRYLSIFDLLRIDNVFIYNLKDENSNNPGKWENVFGIYRAECVNNEEKIVEKEAMKVLDNFYNTKDDLSVCPSESKINTNNIFIVSYKNKLKKIFIVWHTKFDGTGINPNLANENIKKKIELLSKNNYDIYDMYGHKIRDNVNKQDLINIYEQPIYIICDKMYMSNNISTALVLDHSGSMKGKKLKKALKAAEAYFKGMRPDDSGALSIFSTDAETKIFMSEQQSVLDSMDQVLSQVSATQQTNIGAGLEKGYVELNKSSSQSEHKAAVLLSDGRNNRGEWKPIVSKFTQKDWRIFTVGFGDDADVKTLQSIAEQTGGVYSFAQTIDVINAYQEISAHIQNKSVLLAVNEFLGPNGKLTYQVPVGTNSEALNVYTDWQGSHLKNILTSPDGKRYSKQNLHGDTGRYVEGDVYQMLEVSNPRTGDWKIETSWDEPPPSPEQVNISVSEKTDIFANMLSFRSQYSRNDPVIINVQAAEIANAGKKVRLSDTQIEADILKPGQELIRMVQAQGKSFTMYKDVRKDLTRTIKLFDDGRHHDYKAGDRIFGNVFHETDLNGGYLVIAHVTGRKRSGDQVQRTLKASFQVGPISQNQVTNSQVVNFLDSTQARSKGSKRLKKSRNLLEQRRQNDPAQRIQKMQDSSAADNINKLLQGDN
ncbi:MAG: VWA domain-containing protein [Desulfovermiculus sp.]|nr:VWA domain-containing protein [Desulfovermiculus sp.]